MSPLNYYEQARLLTYYEQARLERYKRCYVASVGMTLFTRTQMQRLDFIRWLVRSGRLEA